MQDKPTVLIVDDAPVNIRILAACLEDQYHIKVSTSGEQCLELISAEPKIDLILLDIEMPDMDGYEVCRRLKNNVITEPLPVIFVTGKNNDEDEERGLKLGAVDYITKPVSPAIVAARVSTHITLKQQREKLEAMAMRDQLTGLYNRHFLMEVSSHKVAQAIRHKQALSLLMIDIDHFKTINDTHGHPAGDAVLQAVAELMPGECRKEDVVVRFGGEEFVILLDQCDASSAEVKAQSLRKKIELLKPQDIKVTISIGLAQLDNGKDNFSDFLKRADLALYQAKNNGRNRVEVI